MSFWCSGQLDLWNSNSIFLGQALTITTDEAQFESGPYIDKESGTVIAVAARVDNRFELATSLGLSLHDMQWISDGELVKQAYLYWGERACLRIYGQWSFAAWHPREHKLFIARDHYGATSLYYYVDEQFFIFSSSRQALLKLGLSPVKIDELFLAEILVSSTSCHGERTVHTSIRRLPPAHTITITPDNYNTRQYWFLEDVPVVHFPNRHDYINKFNDIFEEAVRSQLRVPSCDGNANNIAIALSSGLDSSAVAVTAARILQEKNKRLNAYTSVPLTAGKPEDSCIYNESPYAEATARFAGNIDHYSINSADISPIQAIRRSLQILCEPIHAAGNMFWLLNLYQCAAEH